MVHQTHHPTHDLIYCYDKQQSPLVGGDVLSPRYTQARGLRAERVCEAEHFWT